ncbi:MAG: GNAT family N-acetyltransferase [Lamprobacter sp.]|uniref:GNAT family N-acetyltransferase n=1 Tax=Lamprobacter sp. TaxID=3100796 RepID=UPI002B262C9E|nr:GNAT family N-acetyltransferase [Lamprobacter sp.]MEA3640881.1 GNAT family N-acetyltransferase [Lamprobacter sp.]
MHRHLGNPKRKPPTPDQISSKGGCLGMDAVTPCLRPPDEELRVVAVTDPAELDAHAAAWDRLIQSCPVAYPSQSHGWLKAFYRYKLDPEEQMLCLFVYQGARLVGVLPLVGGFRAHGLGRAGHHYRVPWHDYHTVRVDLLTASNPASILRACLRHLSATGSGPPIIRWRKVPATSPTLTAFQEGLEDLGLLYRSSGLEHRLSLPTDFDAFLGGLDSKFRRELLRQERRLKERALTAYRLREASRGVEENLARFMAVEHSGWKGERGGSIQALPNDPPLYLAAGQAFAANGWLEWNFLEADGQEIAAQFAVRLNGMLFLWKVGYRESFANCAPGHLLFLRALEQTFTQGDVKTVNFMAHRHWLRVWGVKEHPVYNLIVYSREWPPARLATMLEATQAAGYSSWEEQGNEYLDQRQDAHRNGVASLPQRAAPEPPDDSKRSDRALVIWAGDMNLGRRQHYRMAEIGAEQVLGGIAILRNVDLRIANLECVVATCGEQGSKGSRNAPYYYRARPEMLRILTSAGIDLVATANNHSGDYGAEALLEQGRWLDAVGIGQAGTGVNLDAALRPVLRRAGNLNVALFSLDATTPRFAATADSPGGAYLDANRPDLWFETLAPRIAAIRERAQVVLVAVHWGRNHREQPTAQTRALGRAILDAGADAVLGASAHWFQGVEIHRQRPILYDAGNLLFDSLRDNLHRGGLFVLNLSHAGVEGIRFIPIGVGFGYSVQRSGSEARKALAQFRERCTDLGTPVFADADHSGLIQLSPPQRATPAAMPPAPYSRYDLSVLDQACASPTMPGTVAEVPEAARIEAVHLGPLTLLGLSVRPRAISHRQLLWVDSYWRCEAPIDEDIRLNIRAVPIQPSRMPAWGKCMEHDPGDWLAPTSRWPPGVIVRDLYGLRAPPLSEMDNVDLRIEIGMLSRQHPQVPLYLGPLVRLAIPELGAPPAATAATTAAPLYRTAFPALVNTCQPGQTWTATQLQAVTGGTWLVPPPAGWFIRSAAYQRSHIQRLPAPFFFVAHELSQRLHHAQSTRPKRDYDRHRDLPALAPRLAGAMVSRPVAGLPADFPLLQVPDPIQSLMDLGLAARQRYAGHLVAVTGTAGKSSVVAMLQHLLTSLCDCQAAVRPPILATQANYNTRIDALAILANLHPEQAAAVVEIAQSALWMKRGPVTRLIHPTISVITEIGISQSDRRVTAVADTARWKSRIVDGLVDPAVAVIGEHLPYFEDVRRKAARHAKDIMLFGESRQAQVRLRALEPVDSPSGPSQRLIIDTPRGRIDFRLPLPSQGMARNALAALAVILAMDLDVAAAAKALETITLGEGCLRQQAIRLRHGVVTLIDDSYNATVTSMRNALQVLAAARPERGRKVAVLGRIVHLGNLAQSLHEDLAQPLLETGVALVMTHGPEMRYLRAKLPAELLGPHCTQAQEVVRHLHELTQPDDLILLKGSRRESDFGEISRLLLAAESDPPPNAKLDDKPHEKPHAKSRESLRDAGPRAARSGKTEPTVTGTKAFSGTTESGPASLSPPPPPTPPSRSASSRFAFTESLLIEAAKRRQLTITRHPGGDIEIADQGCSAVFRRNSPDHSILAASLCADRHRASKLLAWQGLPTPEGAVFRHLDAAQAYFSRRQTEHESLDWPVCVKPAITSMGQGITPVVRKAEALVAAWELARQYHERVVLETALEGRIVRILVLGGQARAAYECLPIALEGNGQDHLATLMRARTERRSTNPWLRQWPVVRQEVFAQSGLELDTIPDAGAFTLLSRVTSVANGCDTLVLTERLHASLRELAEQAVHCFPGLHLACVTLVCEDPERDRASQRALILKIDERPALADLAFPAWGQAVDLSLDLLDHALDMARRRRPSEHPPCIRPAAPFQPPATRRFALDGGVEGQLLRHAARARGLHAERRSSKLTRIADADRVCLFYQGMSPGTRVVARRATNGNKAWMKQLLRAAGLPTPTDQVFRPEQQAVAWDALQRRGVPVVIKPQSGSWGRGVTTEVVEREQFEQAWRLAVQTRAKRILMEDHAPGQLYRLFVVGHTLVAAAQVLPARIIGDGERSIQALVEAQNRAREQDPCLAQCPIMIGPTVKHRLEAQGLTQNDVLDAGYELSLDTVANIGVGGTCQDVTDQVHPDFAPIAVQARRAVFDPPHVGVDLIAQEIAMSPMEQPWTIIEVNTNPDLSMHHFPTSGQPRDVGGVLIESLFMAQRTNDCSFRLRPSTIPGAGVGVFALHDIEQGTFLAVKPRATAVGKTVAKAKIPEGLRAYCIEKKDGRLRCPKEFSHIHLVWFLNHSEKPNAEKRKDGFYAKTRIDAGDEIFINYETL